MEIFSSRTRLVYVHYCTVTFRVTIRCCIVASYGISKNYIVRVSSAKRFHAFGDVAFSRVSRNVFEVSFSYLVVSIVNYYYYYYVDTVISRVRLRRMFVLSTDR